MKKLYSVLSLSGKNKLKPLYLFIHWCYSCFIIQMLGFRFHTASIIKCVYLGKDGPIMTNNPKKS